MLSVVWAVGATLFAVASALLVHALWLRRRVCAHLAALPPWAPSTGLVEGPASITGDVEAQADWVVRVTIVQRGARRTLAIALRTSGVEHVSRGALQREALATLTPRARVTATGRLVAPAGGGAYRGEPRWTLVPDGGRIVVSSVRPGTRAAAVRDALLDEIPALAGLVLAGPAGALFATIVGSADRTGWRLAYDEVALATLVALVTPLVYAHHLRRLRFWWQAPRLHDTEVERVQRR